MISDGSAVFTAQTYAAESSVSSHVFSRLQEVENSASSNLLVGEEDELNQHNPSDVAGRLPEMVGQLNQTEPAQHRLHFSVAELSGKTVIEVTDQKTGELIRQIPSEEAVAFSEHWAKAQQLLSPFAV